MQKQLIVTDAGDAGPGTLRAQIAAADPGDTITFAPGLAGKTITLSSTLVVDQPIIIDGSGANVTISGNHAVTVFDVNFNGPGAAVIKGLSIADGYHVGTTGAPGGTHGTTPIDAKGGPGGDAAGGIFVESGSKLNLVDDKFSGNSATGGIGGTGGLYSTGLLNKGGDGGTGGSAADDVFVEPGAVVTASDLHTRGGSVVVPGAGGDPNALGGSTGDKGQTYTFSNDSGVHDAFFCFVSGTRISTLRGEIPVETLQPGDMAVTASGAIRPIVWIGHRDFDCTNQPLPSDAWPVRVRAGAFGCGRPERDLWLSPGHPVLVGEDADEVLVPIMCLINGTSIARVRLDRLTYWHVELDEHDILLAEGLPAESFLDYGNRLWFEEGADHALLNPDFVVPGLAGRCRPVAIEGPMVETERRRLDAIFATQLTRACTWPEDASIELTG